MTFDLIIIEHEHPLSHTCELCRTEKVEELKQHTKVGRLLDELQRKSEREQKENPDSDATKEFKKNLDILEKAYKEEIPKSVEEYQKEYHNFVANKLPNAEEQFKKLVHATDDDDNPGYEFRKAIRKLRYECYTQKEAYLKTEWQDAKHGFKNGKCCYEQALMLKKKVQENFDSYKKFKEQVNSWFKELDDIYNKADTIIKTTENYKVVYAYRLEFESILNEVKKLRINEANSNVMAKDYEWLRNLLGKILWRNCIITYESFYWHKNWLEIVSREKKSQEHYETFKKIKKDNFIREAQDVEPYFDELDDNITVTIVDEDTTVIVTESDNNTKVKVIGDDTTVTVVDKANTSKKPPRQNVVKTSPSYSEVEGEE